jgi:hypothetical protein
MKNKNLIFFIIISFIQNLDKFGIHYLSLKYSNLLLSFYFVIRFLDFYDACNFQTDVFFFYALSLMAFIQHYSFQ